MDSPMDHPQRPPGNSITIDPVARLITHIDGRPVAVNTPEMQAWVARELNQIAMPQESDDA